MNGLNSSVDANMYSVQYLQILFIYLQIVSCAGCGKLKSYQWEISSYSTTNWFYSLSRGCACGWIHDLEGHAHFCLRYILLAVEKVEAVWFSSLALDAKRFIWNFICFT